MDLELNCFGINEKFSVTPFVDDGSEISKMQYLVISIDNPDVFLVVINPEDALLAKAVGSFERKLYECICDKLREPGLQMLISQALPATEMTRVYLSESDRLLQSVE